MYQWDSKKRKLNNDKSKNNNNNKKKEAVSTNKSVNKTNKEETEIKPIENRPKDSDVTIKAPINNPAQ